MKQISVEQQEKLKVVNLVISKFAEKTVVEHRDNGWYVTWVVCGKTTTKRWQLLGGGSMYPVWHRKWGHGGTCTTALTQLMRWLQGKPVLPLGTWRYWTGETVKMGDPSIVELLRSAGYPVQVKCVVCGDTIENGLDWWYLDKVSGPCHFGGACRDKQSRVLALLSSVAETSQKCQKKVLPCLILQQRSVLKRAMFSVLVLQKEQTNLLLSVVLNLVVRLSCVYRGLLTKKPGWTQSRKSTVIESMPLLLFLKQGMTRFLNTTLTTRY